MNQQNQNPNRKLHLPNTFDLVDILHLSPQDMKLDMTLKPVPMMFHNNWLLWVAVDRVLHQPNIVDLVDTRHRYPQDMVPDTSLQLPPSLHRSSLLLMASWPLLGESYSSCCHYCRRIVVELAEGEVVELEALALQLIRAHIGLLSPYSQQHHLHLLSVPK